MKYGLDMTKAIAELLEGGANRTDTAAMVGISYETFTVWMQKADFSDAVKKAEQVCKQRCINVVQKAALGTWQAAAWWLERKHPAEFGLKKDQLPDPTDIPQRMAERAAELLKKLEEKRGASVPAAATNGTH